MLSELRRRLFFKILIFLLIHLFHICNRATCYNEYKYINKEEEISSLDRTNECKSLEYRIFSHQTFSINYTFGFSLKTKSKDIATQECLQMFTTDSKLVNQIHFTYKRKLLAEEPTEHYEKSYRVNVFIFDFSNIGGDAYIDFSRIDLKNLENKLYMNEKNSILIINLVTRQFLTFNLLNLPLLKTKYLTKLIVLLNGECNLELIEKKLINVSQSDRLQVEVFNSPIGSTGLTHTETTDYLRKMLFIPQENNLNIEYIEHISKFCHITHIKIDLENLILTNNGIGDDEVELVKHLEHVDMLDVSNIPIEYSLISRCVFNFQDQTEKFKEFENKSIYAKKLLNVNHVYLFEIEQNALFQSTNDDNFFLDENNYLRIFVKECDVNLVYTLIFYIVRTKEVDVNLKINHKDTNKLKRIIIDNSHCALRIFSNAEIYDILDNKYQNYETLKISQNDLDDLKISIATMFNLKWFYYLKINQYQSDVEFRFMNENFATDLAANKFLNRIQQQLFIYDEEENVASIESKASSEEMANKIKSPNRSLKFALREADLLEYFQGRLISLAKYLNTEVIDNNFFFISNQKCLVNYLYDKLTYKNDKFLILFNSKMYNQIINTSSGQQIVNNDCFYSNKESKVFHLTLGFSLNEINHFQTTYFALKKQTMNNDKTTKGAQKTNNQFLTNLEKLKQKSSEDYYESVIKFTRESYYLTQTTNIFEQKKARLILKNKTGQTGRIGLSNRVQKMKNNASIELATKIHLFTLDDLITWEMEKCWLSDTDILLELNSQTTRATTTNDYQYKESYEDYEYKDDSIAYSVEDDENFTNKKRRDLDFPAVIQKSLEQNVEILNYEITSVKNTFKLNREKSFYDLILKLSIKFNNLLNPNKKNFVLCNIIPKLRCEMETPTSCSKNSSIYIFFSNTKDFSQKMKTVVLGKFDLEKNFTTFTRTFIYNSNGTKVIMNKIPPIRNESNDAIIKESTTNAYTTSTKPAEKNEPSSSTFRINTHSEESVVKLILKWLTNNKISVILVLTLITFSIIILIMLKLVNKNKNCKSAPTKILGYIKSL